MSLVWQHVDCVFISEKSHGDPPAGGPRGGREGLSGGVTQEGPCRAGAPLSAAKVGGCPVPAAAPRSNVSPARPDCRAAQRPRATAASGGVLVGTPLRGWQRAALPAGQQQGARGLEPHQCGREGPDQGWQESRQRREAAARVVSTQLPPFGSGKLMAFMWAGGWGLGGGGTGKGAAQLLAPGGLPARGRGSEPKFRPPRQALPAAALSLPLTVVPVIVLQPQVYTC